MMDVIVVGAGPVGSFTAWHLARAGVRVLVVEEHPTIGEPVHCTGVVGRRVFERFGLPRDSVVHELCGATFYSPGGNNFTVESTPPPAYVIDRPAFDRTLANLAAAAGADYLLGARAQEMELRPWGVTVGISADGARRELHARMCVIAGGSRCRLGVHLGLRYPCSYANGAQVEATIGGETRHAEVYCGRNVAPGSFGWVVPLGDGRARVGVRAFGEVRERLARFLRHPLVRLRVSALKEPAMGGAIPAEPAAKTYAERVLTVGDAAGQVKTTTGGGVSFGLLCAQIAAEVAAQACRADDFQESSLRAYQRRWHRAVAREMRLGLMARRLAALLRDDDLDRLFRRVCDRALAQRLSQKADFDHHARHLLALLRTPALLALLKGALA